MVIDGSYNDINKYPHLFNLRYKICKIEKKIWGNLACREWQFDDYVCMYICGYKITKDVEFW